MDIDRNILVRYFQGETTDIEKEAINQWLEKNAANRQSFIRERIRFDASLIIDERAVISGRGNTKRITFNILKIASVILILIGSSYIFNFYLFSGQQASMQTIYVPPGNRTSLTLPDGTTVWLNSNTTLTYPNIFSKKERNVKLDGEAYFEVNPDKKKAFIVKTDKYNIEVLGTTFNIDSYTGKSNFETALFTGKVKLYKENEEEAVFLSAGQLAQLNGSSLEVYTLDSNKYRWRDGLIIIEGKSFEEIMEIFEKYYDQQIIIENEKVKDLGYRGKLRIVDGIDHALRVLQKDFGFTYKREEETNKIYIY